MIIKEITIGISRTFNLGSYESCRVEAAATTSLDSESAEDAARNMLPHLRRVLLLAYQDHVDGKGHGKDL